MSERGRKLYAEVSVGSNSSIKASPGTLYGIHVSPANGTTVHVVDGELGATPNLNVSATGTIARVGTYANAVPDFLDFEPGVGFEKLTVAATSNARLTVVYE